MIYQARCVDFAYGHKIVVNTDNVDDSTRIITSVFPIGSSSPLNITSSGFENYANRDDLNLALSAAIEVAKQSLVPALTPSAPPLNLPDPLSPSSRPMTSAPGPTQTTLTPKTEELKAYKQSVGNETPADVARDMMGIISSVKAGQASYVDTAGQAKWETLRGSFERLLGLKSDEIPEEQLLAGSQKPFVYFVYALLHDKGVVQSIDGQEVSGQDLINKLYESMIKRLRELDGHNLVATMSVADAIRTTGTQILSTIASAKAGVTPTKQKISDDLSKGVNKAQGIINTIESFASTSFSPLEQKELFKEEAKFGSIDYQKFRFDRNDAGNVFATTPETASLMQNTSLSSAWLNTGADTMRKQKLDLLNRSQAYAARYRFSGDVYSVLVEGKGLENDPNTLTMRMVVSYFASCLKTMKGTCSECRHYNGAGSYSPSRDNTKAPSPPLQPESHPSAAWDTIYNQAKSDWESGNYTKYNNVTASLSRIISGTDSSQEQKNQASQLKEEITNQVIERGKGYVIVKHVDTMLTTRDEVQAERAKLAKAKPPSCALGFTNPNNTNKGPDDYCWVDAVAPGRGASGIKYELNTDISKKIRELAKNLSKG